MSTFDKIMQSVKKGQKEESNSNEDLAKSLSSDDDPSSLEETTEEIGPSDSSTSDLDSDFANSKEKKSKSCKTIKQKILTPNKSDFQTHSLSKN